VQGKEKEKERVRREGGERRGEGEREREREREISAPRFEKLSRIGDRESMAWHYNFRINRFHSKSLNK